MIIVISPAKRMKGRYPDKPYKYTIPDYLNLSENLVNILKECSVHQLQNLMKINLKLAENTLNNLHSWNKNFKPENSLQAIFAYSGDVFTGIDSDTIDINDMNFAQKHLRILSGLHGILRPLDLVQPYRLEIGLRLKGLKVDNLYEYWSKTVTANIENCFKEVQSKILINLASNEYFSTINTKQIQGLKIITPVFKEYKDGKYKFISVLGKKARGLMVRYILQNRITNYEELKFFDKDGYEFNIHLSDNYNWLFTRG